MQQTQTPHTPLSNSRQLRKGILAGLPLSIAVIPWGILAGSYAVHCGHSASEGGWVYRAMYPLPEQLAKISSETSTG